ncbi:hypothetical protein THRCLA_01177 [Thraustotheca clavata]|uniref:HECT-type E3 ubiquitin transferase n=1 Tax=Thraustotheca clavata TaxID=74557 RepID=A0A1W0A943_9STRA|nr:hypothetical protein THRCLA_01177 [Thraustotheca clavata]
MFRRDAELTSASRAKALLVEQARAQRDERERKRALESHVVLLQSLVRRRQSNKRTIAASQAEIDRKLTDVDTLEQVLQQRIILPAPALLPLLQNAFYLMRSSPVDSQKVLLKLIVRVQSNWTLAQKRWAAAFGDLPIVMLRRFVVCCIELSAFRESSSAIAFVKDLIGVNQDSPCSDSQKAMCQYLSQDSLILQSTLFGQKPRSTTLCGLIRSIFIKCEDADQMTALWEILLYLSNECKSTIVPDLIVNIFSLPFMADKFPKAHLNSLQTILPLIFLTEIPDEVELPTSPIQALSSSIFILANVLWLSSSYVNYITLINASYRVDLKPVLRVYMKWCWTMFQIVPDYTFSGESMAWHHLSKSHSVPVPIPPHILKYLQYFYSYSTIHHLVPNCWTYDDSAIIKPLTTTLPVPMLPNALLDEEKFGFGNIAQQPVTSAWKRLWNRKPQWASKLFDSFKSSSATSAPIAPTSYTPTISKAFESDLFLELAKLYGLFLFRWTPKDSKLPHPLLSTLSFYKSPSGQSLVTVLWLYIQETLDIDSFAKTTVLEAIPASDGVGNVLLLFLQCYNQLLVVLDESEMYDHAYPLPLCEVERVILFFKPMLYRCFYDNPSKHVDAFGDYLVHSATHLLQQLYNRCARQPFCNVTSWVLTDLDGSAVLDRIFRDEPRAMNLLRHMPYLLMYADRVRLFETWVRQDRERYQAEGVPGYRINIRRGYILEDGLTKLNVIKGDLKKKIQVHFVNSAGGQEVGIDAGGLFKEFWTDLSQLAFDPNYGLFQCTKDQLLYPNPHSGMVHRAHLVLFEFLGRILGKALYEKIVVQPKFARFFLTKLLGRPNPWHDLPSLDPELYKNLSFLKTYDGDISDLGLTFSIGQDCFGVQKQIELIPGGGNVSVNSENRFRYIHLAANFYLNTQIRDQSAAFLIGLQDVIDPMWLNMFNEPELQVLISGSSVALDIHDLKQATVYAGGYFSQDKRIQWLWKALESFTPAEQSQFLRFVTSCQRAPILGFQSLHPPFCIQKITISHDQDKLPSAATCFNTLKLPTYSSYKVLREKLRTSITSNAGFELT